MKRNWGLIAVVGGCILFWMILAFVAMFIGVGMM